MFEIVFVLKQSELDNEQLIQTKWMIAWGYGKTWNKKVMNLKIGRKIANIRI